MQKETKEEVKDELKEGIGEEEKKEETEQKKGSQSSGGIALVIILLLAGIFGMAYLKGGTFSSSGLPSFPATSFTISQKTQKWFNLGEKKSVRGKEIVSNAKSYLKKCPVYKDQYYASGYPNDNYGVCTDVIGIALRDSGYDLMELVYEDELQNPQAYPDGENPDVRIDFRRVQNLKVYFERKATTLTTDIFDTSAWQEGDIVVWKEHIGLISDRRNARDIPYVLHHSGSEQSEYEEDILEEKSDIIGHYRIS